MSLQKKCQHKQKDNSTDKELIDISNDDEIFRIDPEIQNSSMKIPKNTCTESSPIVLKTIMSKPDTLKMKVSKTDIPMEWYIYITYN